MGCRLGSWQERVARAEAEAKRKDTGAYGRRQWVGRGRFVPKCVQ